MKRLVFELRLTLFVWLLDFCRIVVPKGTATEKALLLAITLMTNSAAAEQLE